MLVAALIRQTSARPAACSSVKKFLSSSIAPPAPDHDPILSPAHLYLRRALPSDESFILQASISTARPLHSLAPSPLIQLANRLSDFPVPPWRVPEHINRADDAIMLADLHKPLPANFFVVAERLEQRAGFAFASSRLDYFTGEQFCVYGFQCVSVALIHAMMRRGAACARGDDGS